MLRRRCSLAWPALPICMIQYFNICTCADRLHSRFVVCAFGTVHTAYIGPNCHCPCFYLPSPTASLRREPKDLTVMVMATVTATYRLDRYRAWGDLKGEAAQIHVRYITVHVLGDEKRRRGAAANPGTCSLVE